MNFYRAALILFVLGNIVLVSRYMSIYNVPWSAGMIFFGYILVNGPILVAIQFSSKIDRTLAGHWLNWLNLFNPLFVGLAGFWVYGFVIHVLDGDPTVFLLAPMLINFLSLFFLSMLFQIYVFVDNR